MENPYTSTWAEGKCVFCQANIKAGEPHKPGCEAIERAKQAGKTRPQWKGEVALGREEFPVAKKSGETARTEKNGSREQRLALEKIKIAFPDFPDIPNINILDDAARITIEEHLDAAFAMLQLADPEKGAQRKKIMDEAKKGVETAIIAAGRRHKSGRVEKVQSPAAETPPSAQAA